MFSKISYAIQIFKLRKELKRAVTNWLFFTNTREQNFWGSVSEEDEKGIVELVEKAAVISGPIVEIGALFGFTTQLIATYKPTEKELITVENFTWNPFCLPNDAHRTITRRVLRYNLTHCNTSLFDGSNHDFYESYTGGRPSMIFIDANHSYESVKGDIQWALKQGIPIIAGHDYCDLHPGVIRAVDEAFKGDVEVRGSVWHHKKKEFISLMNERAIF
jgi:hypothetical protein